MTINSFTPALNSVSSIKATSERGVFIVHCNITDVHGSTYDTDYCSRPDDMFGLNPTLRRWLAENSSFPVQPHLPPTIEVFRASLPPLSARQFRLGLINAGISPNQVTAAINLMPPGPDRDKAQIEWEYAPIFNRSHNLIGTIGSLLDLGDVEIDVAWMIALDL
ncbi:hypothetical protein [Sinorhizobium alkalisoli]|uniref:hypothetical protein n=1 Tax=Sinorhizobium alkalisoli TaxID=1752398 RepID=UPI00124F26B8|nr:hypothetical protein [Sinorhizobium alkalisoli]MCA1494987.1 hypothetical protein [Ensifer sp. NBAIM29]